MVSENIVSPNDILQVCSGNTLPEQLAEISSHLTNIEIALATIIFLLIVFWCYERIKFTIRQFNKTR